jgi:hypothetical protein
LEKVVVTIPSINLLKNLARLDGSYADLKIIVVDEGQEEARRGNRRLLSRFTFRFFGPKERVAWMRARLGLRYKKFLHVIAPRSRGEISLAFLAALEDGADVIIQIDDDVVPQPHFINEHLAALDGQTKRTVTCQTGRWYNTLRSLDVVEPYRLKLFPRGHPYAKDARLEDYQYGSVNSEPSVLNMGHWTGHPDLDAITILSRGGIDGRCDVEAKRLKEHSLAVSKGTFFSVCSMNLAFRRKITPAMYQLYMGCMGVDRYDDIWSGIFVKKIADYHGDRTTVGLPSGFHDKRPRSVFADVLKESNGLGLNEELWRRVDRFQLSGSSYWDSYDSLTDQLADWANSQNSQFNRKFLRIQTSKMKLWLRLFDLLE